MFGCCFIILGTLIIVFKHDDPWTFFGGRMIIGFGGAFPIIAGSSRMHYSGQMGREGEAKEPRLMDADVLEVAHPRHAQSLSSAFACICTLPPSPSPVVFLELFLIPAIC